MKKGAKGNQKGNGDSSASRTGMVNGVEKGHFSDEK